jgi:hypothetical protein
MLLDPEGPMKAPKSIWRAFFEMAEENPVSLATMVSMLDRKVKAEMAEIREFTDPKELAEGYEDGNLESTVSRTQGGKTEMQGATGGADPIATLIKDVEILKLWVPYLEGELLDLGQVCAQEADEAKCKFVASETKVGVLEGISTYLESETTTLRTLLSEAQAKQVLSTSRLLAFQQQVKKALEGGRLVTATCGMSPETEEGLL